MLATLYLIFNEGYAATGGDSLQRRDLCGEAIRLARLTRRLMPDETEAAGLLALMLLQDSRREARTDEQRRDRAARRPGPGRCGTASEIAEGLSLVERALRAGPAGPYALQAAIAAVHAEAPTAADTDWPQIAGLYDELYRRLPTPVVALNRAVAVAMARRPGARASSSSTTSPERGTLDGYHLLHATRADLLRRLGRADQAQAAYERALALATNPVERGVPPAAARREPRVVGDRLVLRSFSGLQHARPATPRAPAKAPSSLTQQAGAVAAGRGVLRDPVQWARTSSPAGRSRRTSSTYRCTNGGSMPSASRPLERR